MPYPITGLMMYDESAISMGAGGLSKISTANFLSSLKVVVVVVIVSSSNCKCRRPYVLSISLVNNIPTRLMKAKPAAAKEAASDG